MYSFLPAVEEAFFPEVNMSSVAMEGACSRDTTAYVLPEVLASASHVRQYYNGICIIIYMQHMV
ncbi:hypothetical protein DPMN_006820 [Dreissena polymorpha]|uniref:Uncharacterized protein n=1 Tax=Dreissena polymorpha TaxID=45954 RepID=A0A9D4MW39_DREPO|nr:hypothetical protein DPMN_006820 [Dreissena polymorpha]